MWLSKTRWERGGVGPNDALDLAHGAMQKVIKALKREAGYDVN